MTARTLWIPSVNNHGAFGRWGFIEIADPWDAESAIRGIIGMSQRRKNELMCDKDGMGRWLSAGLGERRRGAAWTRLILVGGMEENCPRKERKGTESEG